MTADRRLVVALDDPRASDAATSGTKAANLARLLRMGFPVPPGVVVVPGAEADRDAALGQLADLLPRLASSRWAVRSSARAEDLEGASFAGQYETELDVPADEVSDAVRRILASAASARVNAYRAARRAFIDPTTTEIAVLVQAMVPAATAGVAFTADPVTGDRADVVVTAVRGLGERLVSGDTVPEQWRIRGNAVRREDGPEAVIDEGQARSIAELARRVEVTFAAPQDIEWAIADHRLYLLQARPMTALPTVEWRPPFKAWWLRNLRLGELLPEPVTPLFATWLLPLLEEGHSRATREDIGIAVEPASAIINGWYYTTPQGRGSPAALLGRLARHPRALTKMFALLIRPFRDPGAADRFLSELADRWRQERLPRYEAAVATAEQRLEEMSTEELFETVDRIGRLAGEVHWSVESVAGAAWKIEAAFGRFVRSSVPDLMGSPQQMLIGLPGTEPSLERHAVESADWYWPTAGERDNAAPDSEVLARHARLREEGDRLVGSCRSALRGRATELDRFDELLRVARKYALLREQQTRSFTIGWPVMRRAVLRLGSVASGRDAIERPEDVFFLERSELRAVAMGGSGDARSQVAVRRRNWESFRRLLPPLEIGHPPPIASGAVAGAITTARRATRHAASALVGHPASPGRAKGIVRIVTSVDDFDRFLQGEVLVARATTPAWTPLFSRAAAVVTDGGSLAAHASLVAREFGIPAVVATGDATRRLRDGQLVTVDGGAGVVEVAPDGMDAGQDRPRRG